MDSDNESYYEDSSSEEEQEVAGPLHIQVEVDIEEPPESPPPGSPELVLPEPIQVGEPAQVWELPDDGSNFLNYYTRADIIELRGWAQISRERRNEEGYFIEEPPVSQSLAGFLRENYGPQWEWKLLQPSADIMFEKLLAYIAGYARSTSFNRRMLRQQYASWSIEERAYHLRLLAESGGLLELE